MYLRVFFFHSVILQTSGAFFRDLLTVRAFLLLIHLEDFPPFAHSVFEYF